MTLGPGELWTNRDPAQAHQRGRSGNTLQVYNIQDTFNDKNTFYLLLWIVLMFLMYFLKLKMKRQSLNILYSDQATQKMNKESNLKLL